MKIIVLFEDFKVVFAYLGVLFLDEVVYTCDCEVVSCVLWIGIWIR